MLSSLLSPQPGVEQQQQQQKKIQTFHKNLFEAQIREEKKSQKWRRLKGKMGFFKGRSEEKTQILLRVGNFSEKWPLFFGKIQETIPISAVF